MTFENAKLVELIDWGYVTLAIVLIVCANVAALLAFPYGLIISSALQIGVLFVGLGLVRIMLLTEFSQHLSDFGKGEDHVKVEKR